MANTMGWNVRHDGCGREQIKHVQIIPDKTHSHTHKMSMVFAVNALKWKFSRKTKHEKKLRGKKTKQVKRTKSARQLVKLNPNS